jgi:hypothetical protein
LKKAEKEKKEREDKERAERQHREKLRQEEEDARWEVCVRERESVCV